MYFSLLNGETTVSPTRTYPSVGDRYIVIHVFIMACIDIWAYQPYNKYHENSKVIILYSQDERE